MGQVGGALSKKDIDQRSLMSLKGVITERSLTELAATGESCSFPAIAFQRDLKSFLFRQEYEHAL